MINVRHAKEFCSGDITEIENYEQAVSDTSQTWVCHHILGEILSKEQLIEHNFYYDVPACMLKFVTKREHRQIHNKGKHLSEETRKKISEAHKGKVFSEETRNKISYANKGRHHSEESCKNMSAARKGKILSEEHKRNISQSLHKKSAFYQKFGMTVAEYKNNNKLSCSYVTILRRFKKGEI